MKNGTMPGAMFRDTKPGAWSPWGQVQGPARKILDGVYSVSTAGHGGIVLSTDRAAFVNDLFPLFQPFTGDSRYWEEDEDWAVPTLAFAREIVAKDGPRSRRMVWAAVRHVRSAANRKPMDLSNVAISNRKFFEGKETKWKHVAEYLDGMGKDVQAVHDEFAAEVAELWERGGMSSVGAKRERDWVVMFHRESDGSRRTVSMPYPMKLHYTTEELDAYDAAGTVDVVA